MLEDNLAPVIDRLDELVAEADGLHEQYPGREYNQPPRFERELAEELLPEGAPRHHVAHVAHAIVALEL